MSYSRRQLYAFGETFGDSATSMEAGGRIIYGGGGGKSKPQPTTTITESGPTVTNRTTLNEIPQYLTNASQDLIARGQALTSRPYEAYTGARVAEFSPLMNQAFERIGNQQVAGQIGEATGLASLAGQRAMDYGQFQTGVQQYMNPYMQNVVDIERRKAQEAADQQSAMLSGQAAKMGAFGGSGAALQQRALRRDTAQQLSDIQAQGLDRAYQSAVGQYNQGIASGLSAAGQLGGLGQQQFGQQMDITQGLGTAGDVQRQRQQALLDVGYGDYLTAQKYPYEQLAFQQGLISGVPYSTTQRTNEVSTPGKTVSQMTATPAAGPNPASQVIGAGLAAYGAIDGGSGDANGANFASGGIASLSDAQIGMRQQMPNITELARMSLDAEAQRRAQLRLAAEGAQDAQMGAQQPTVADEEMAMIEQGIGGLPVGDMEFADGGIVGFEKGGPVYGGLRFEDLKPYRAGAYFRSGDKRIDPLTNEPIEFGDFLRLQQAEKAKAAEPAAQSIIQRALQTNPKAAANFAATQTPEAVADAGIADLIKKAPEKTVDKAGIAKLGSGPAQVPKTPAMDTDGIMSLRRAEADRQTAAETEAAKVQQEALAADRAAQQVDVEEAGKSYSDRESRLKKREAGMKGEKERSVNMAFVEAGLAIMAGQSPNALLNIAQGAQQGVRGYQARLEKINESREKLDDDFSRLYELRQAKVDASRKELRALNKQEADLKASGLRNLSNIAGALAGEGIKLKEKELEQAFELDKQRRDLQSRERIANIGAAGRGTDKQPDRTKQYLDFLGKNPMLAMDPTKAMQEFNKMIFMTEGTMPTGPANTPGFRVLGVKP